MAWNQPGGGDRDPWGQRNGQQGPPDLDEVLGKLQAKLSGLFGGRGGGGGSSSGGVGRPGLSSAGLALVLALVLIGWGIMGFFIVEPAEEAVVTRFGEYHRVEAPGLHWAPFLVDTVQKVNVEEVKGADIGFRNVGGQSSVEFESLMLTRDENIVDLQFAVQYRVKSARDYLFNVRDPDLTLRQATESAVREVVGKRTMDFVLTEGRSAVADEVGTLVQDILDGYSAGLNVLTVNMQRAQPPEAVQSAFADAVKAREDEERTKNVARAYAADILPRARGEASAIREEALGYKERVVAAADGETSRFLRVLNEYQKAPAVTRERIYLEAVESVMANTSKVMIDVEGGNNLTYLPLDQLMQPRQNLTDAERRNNTLSGAPSGVQSALDALREQRTSDIRGRDR